MVASPLQVMPAYGYKYSSVKVDSYEPIIVASLSVTFAPAAIDIFTGKRSLPVSTSPS